MLGKVLEARVMVSGPSGNGFFVVLAPRGVAEHLQPPRRDRALDGGGLGARAEPPAGDMIIGHHQPSHHHDERGRDPSNRTLNRACVQTLRV